MAAAAAAAARSEKTFRPTFQPMRRGDRLLPIRLVAWGSAAVAAHSEVQTCEDLDPPTKGGGPQICGDRDRGPPPKDGGPRTYEDCDCDRGPPSKDDPVLESDKRTAYGSRYPPRPGPARRWARPRAATRPPGGRAAARTAARASHSQLLGAGALPAHPGGRTPAAGPSRARRGRRPRAPAERPQVYFSTRGKRGYLLTPRVRG